METVALGLGVLGPRPREAVHDGLGDQQPVVGWRVDDFMGVAIVSLANAIDRSLLCDEVEARVHLVLAVGKVELHHACPTLK